MSKIIMVQGTMSGAGKSLITAGLCRIFKRDGYRAAPFKSQNMALNSYVTGEGLEMGRAPVILTGDIDRGGVFAQLLGTLMLLSKEEQARVKGLVINKFRGDKSLLDSGVKMLENRGGVPVIGVVPYLALSLEDEDSLTERFDRKAEGKINPLEGVYLTKGPWRRRLCMRWPHRRGFASGNRRYRIIGILRNSSMID